jgi:hypothetical protein
MKTKDELRIKVRQILVDYHRRDDYDLRKAEDDMLHLLALPLDLPSYDIQTTAYNEALDQYLKEGINWSATANDVINCDRGNVEQLAADSFFAGAIWMRNNKQKQVKP